ncbi:MAG: hypothetical protein JST94_06975 [Bacteroidetes bacterium]|nr:hypothetical protein [Bacteroidota bacterium]MBS1671180.1 hypothetical protein [Bacteroidota bacterium]
MMLEIEKIQSMSFDDLCKAINNLITNNFSALVQLLYKIDVDEKKLKKVLSENKNTDAAALIANMIIERLKQKQTTKKLFNNHKPDNDADAW